MPTQSVADVPPNTILTIEPDSHGRWLVEENHGLLGGTFISRDAALGFVRSELHAFPGAIMIVALDPAAQPISRPH